TFVKEGSSLVDTIRQPAESHYNDRRYPRTAPGVSQVSIAGPYQPQCAGDTPSRRRLFVCRPARKDQAEGDQGAATILEHAMRRAYRRPIAKGDVDEPMAFYHKGRAAGGFENGIAEALSAVLTNPEFLLRVESDPKKAPSGGVYRISDLELAS